MFLRLGIPIAPREVNCALRTQTHLSNRHLVNGCPHKDYKYRKHNAIMEQIVHKCKAANILVAEKQFQCFAIRTQRRMDLLFNIDSSDVLVDVTTIDASNPSNGFLRGSGLSPSYYPSAATVITAKKKWGKHMSIRHRPNQQILPFVAEVQGRWGHCVRRLFKRLF